MRREETITVVSAKNLSLLSSSLDLLCNCTLSLITVNRFKLIGTLVVIMLDMSIKNFLHFSLNLLFNNIC